MFLEIMFSSIYLMNFMLVAHSLKHELSTYALSYKL